MTNTSPQYFTTRSIILISNQLLGLALILPFNWLWVVLPLGAQSIGSYHIESLGSLSSLGSSEIYSVAQDSGGFIWVGTSLGVSRFDGYTFENFTSADSLPIGKISVIEKDHNGTLYFGGQNGLFYHKNGAIHPFPLPGFHGQILTMKGEHSGGLWLGGVDFVPIYLNTAFLSGSFEENAIDSSRVIPEQVWLELVGDQKTFKIETDPDHNIYFGNDRSLVRFDGQEFKLLWSDQRRNYHINSIVAVSPDSIYWGGERTNLRFLQPHGYDTLIDDYLCALVNSPKGVFALHNDLYGLTNQGFTKMTDLAPFNHSWFQDFILDREGNFWIGAISDLIKIKPVPFVVYEQDQYPNQDDLYSVAQHPNGDILLGGHHGQVYTLSQGKFSPLLPVVPTAEVHAIHVTENNWIWFGSGYQGISLLRNGQLENFASSSGLNDPSCFFFYESPEKELWMGGDQHISRIIMEPDSSIRFVSYGAPDFPNILILFYGATTDDWGQLWAGSSQGIFFLENGSLHQWSFPPPHASFPVITQLARDQEGYLWLSTQGNGLWQCQFTAPGQLAVIKQWKQEEGLPAETWLGLHIDKEDKIWVANSRQICCLDKQRNPNVFCYDTDDAWPEFTTRYIRFYESNDQSVWAVGQNKLVNFSPYTLQSNSLPPQTFIHSVVLMDGKEDIFRFAGKKESKDGLPQKVRLPYDKNFIRFNFTSTSLQNPNKNQFRYRLKNIDQQWQITRETRSIAYLDLSPGHYTFEVLASNNHGIWDDSPAVFSFTIRPPFWQTWWAYLAYSCLFFAALLFARKQIIRREELKNQVKVKQLEKEQIQEIDQLRARFFANISHEFRTPLTLIKAPLEDLLISRKDDRDRAAFLTMHQNTGRLLHLVNQLLDLSRLESNTWSLQPERQDIYNFLHQLAANFHSLADHKQLDFQIHIPKEQLLLEFDPNKLEKIVLNLLSNAIKFTPQQGWVRMKAHFGKQLLIRVGNSGDVIPPEEQAKLFDRFYQAGDRQHQGAGIGLALVRELVELHQGNIAVQSDPKRGTWFSVELPLSKAAAGSGPVSPLPDFDRSFLDFSTPDWTAVGKQVPKLLLGEKPLLLLVEDHVDVRTYIKSKLAETYQLLEAENGQVGLEIAIEKLPDLIISDVMMPVMDGLTFCEKVKTDHRTDHIPVILLTAKADLDSRLSGLETGADDYLAKPFDSRELLVRSRNLIDQRERLRVSLQKNMRNFASTVAVSGAEEKFLRRAIDLIEKRLDQSDFSIEDFATALQLSRVQLHRKLKAITGMNATDFVRNLRLEHAAQLLEQNSDTVSQIAYAVGFNHLSYFAKCFREKYGLAPSAFREKGGM